MFYVQISILKLKLNIRDFYVFHISNKQMKNNMYPKPKSQECLYKAYTNSWVISSIGKILNLLIEYKQCFSIVSVFQIRLLSIKKNQKSYCPL